MLRRVQSWIVEGGLITGINIDLERLDKGGDREASRVHILLVLLPLADRARRSFTPYTITAPVNWWRLPQ